MLLMVAAGLVLCFALLVNALLRPTHGVAALLGISLLSFANVVVVSELAGICYLLNQPIFFLAGHMGLALLAWIFWRRGGRPPLLGALAHLRSRITGQTLLKSMKSFPELYLLGGCIVAAYLIGAFLILRVPPNTGDGLETYLARVGYWLQYGSFFPWPTYYISQILYPINAQCQVLWTVLFSGTDRFAGFVQWLSVPVAVAAIYGLARFFGWGRAQAVFAAFIWSTFPPIVLQATSTQNDLVVSALAASMIYLLYYGLKTGQKGALILSGLAFGLALGTKQTLLFIMPGMGVMMLMVWFTYGRPAFRRLCFWAGAGLGAFVLVGAFIYGCNMVYFGNALGPPEVAARFIDKAYAGQAIGVAERLMNAAIMLIRFCCNAVDVTGLPDMIAAPLHRLKGDLLHPIFSALGLPVQSQIAVQEYAKDWAFDLYWRPEMHEHTAWYGPLSWLVLYPAILWQLWKGLSQREPYRLGLIAMLAGIAFPICLYRAWGGTEGRYFMLGITLCAPFMAPVFRRGLGFGWLRWGIVILGMIVLTVTTLSNRMKPMIGQEAIWGKDRIHLQTMGAQPFRPTIRALNQMVTAEATVGFTGFGPYEYFLFGKELGRKVIYIENESQLNDPQWLQGEGLDYIIVERYAPNGKSPPGYRLLGRSGFHDWLFEFFGRCASDDPTVWPADLMMPLLGTERTPQDRPILTIDQELNGAVGVGTGLVTPRWGLEPWGSGAALWLGSGPPGALGGMLWSDADRQVVLLCHAAPGPAIEDPCRDVELTVRTSRGTQRETGQFEREGQLTFWIQLSPGRNEFQFSVRNTAAAPRGNDRRVLLVFLSQIQVAPVHRLLRVDGAGPSNAPVLTIDPALRDQVGVSPELTTGAWGIEHQGERSWLWLGEGADEGLGWSLWSDARRRVILSFELAPGPARPEPRRHVQLVSQAGERVEEKQARVEEEGRLTVSAILEPGKNTFKLNVLDKAILKTKGDPRPLLLHLRHVRVLPAPEGPGGRFYRFSRGWYAVEGNGPDWWQWTGNGGEWRLFAERDLSATLTGEAMTLQAPNRVDLFLNGQQVGVWDIAWPNFGPFEPLRLDLREGENVVRVAPRHPPGRVDGDPRALGIAVKNVVVTGEDGGVFKRLP